MREGETKPVLSFQNLVQARVFPPFADLLDVLYQPASGSGEATRLLDLGKPDQAYELLELPGEDLTMSLQAQPGFRPAFDFCHQKESHGVFSPSGIHTVGIVSSIAAPADMGTNSRRIV